MPFHLTQTQLEQLKRSGRQDYIEMANAVIKYRKSRAQVDKTRAMALFRKLPVQDQKRIETIERANRSKY